MTSLLQHGCKSLYQSALIDQMRKAQNQTQVKHALSSSTMSRSFTQKLLEKFLKLIIRKGNILAKLVHTGKNPVHIESVGPVQDCIE